MVISYVLEMFFRFIFSWNLTILQASLEDCALCKQKIAIVIVNLVSENCVRKIKCPYCKRKNITGKWGASSSFKYLYGVIWQLVKVSLAEFIWFVSLTGCIKEVDNALYV